MSEEAPEFPFGEYATESQLTEPRRDEILRQLTRFPASLEEALDQVGVERTATVYRAWTISQIVHHLADAQMNWFLRFKVALTTLNPMIVPYDQSDWARLVDANDSDLTPSVKIIQGIHHRWSELGYATPPEDYARTMQHPEHPEPLTLDHALSLATWHCYHHLGQIQWLLANRLS